MRKRGVCCISTTDQGRGKERRFEKVLTLMNAAINASRTRLDCRTRPSADRIIALVTGVRVSAAARPRMSHRHLRRSFSFSVCKGLPTFAKELKRPLRKNGPCVAGEVQQG